MLSHPLRSLPLLSLKTPKLSSPATLSSSLSSTTMKGAKPAPKSAKGTITKGKASSENKEEEEFGFVFYKIAGANVETLYCDHDLLREMKGMILPGGLYRDTVIKMFAALKAEGGIF